MELRQLKYFVNVAQTLNFSDAARKLFITQGTLSQQIKQLEDEIGSQLFIRSSHSVSLTEAGEELLPLAKSTLEASRTCKDRMNDLRNYLGGTLNIGVTHSFSVLLTSCVQSFIKKYPDVKLNIYYKTASELIDMLRDKSLDLILSFKPVKEYEDIEFEVLFVTKLSAVMRKDHPLAKHTTISLSDIERQGLILPGSGLQARRTLEQYIGIDTKRLDVRMELNDPNMIMDILQATMLVSILSSLAAYYRENLIAIPIEHSNQKMSGCVQRLKGSYRKKAADAFLEELRKSAHIHRLRHNLEIK